MDTGDILTYVICFAIGIVGFVIKRKKAASEEPLEDAETVTDKERVLVDEAARKTYGGFIPETPRPTVKPKKTVRPSKTKQTSANAPQTASSPVQEAESEYAIHSAEEARRAFVWSEILNRKY